MLQIGVQPPVLESPKEIKADWDASGSIVQACIWSISSMLRASWKEILPWFN